MKRGHIAAVVAGASHPAPGRAVTADPAALAARTIAGVDTGAARRAAADFLSALGIDVDREEPKCLTISAPTISSSQRRHAAGPHRRVRIQVNRGPGQDSADHRLEPDSQAPIELPPAVITSRDFHAGALSIALEVPDDILGADPQIGIWASISLRRDGTLTQMDRGGNPTINAFINPDGEKDLYNSRQPADDVANYLGPWSKILENSGHHARGGQAGSPHGAARHPPLRSHQARRLPQRPRSHRRRLQHALRLAEPRQGPANRPQAAR